MTQKQPPKNPAEFEKSEILGIKKKRTLFFLKKRKAFISEMQKRPIRDQRRLSLVESDGIKEKGD